MPRGRGSSNIIARMPQARVRQLRATIADEKGQIDALLFRVSSPYIKERLARVLCDHRVIDGMFLKPVADGCSGAPDMALFAAEIFVETAKRDRQGIWDVVNRYGPDFKAIG